MVLLLRKILSTILTKNYLSWFSLYKRGKCIGLCVKVDTMYFDLLGEDALSSYFVTRGIWCLQERHSEDLSVWSLLMRQAAG